MTNQQVQHFKVGLGQFVNERVDVMDTQGLWFLFLKKLKRLFSNS